MVEKAKHGNELDGWFFYPEHAVRLLRLQHAAYVRMVKKLKQEYETSDADDEENRSPSETLALDLLKQFANYTR